MAFATQFTFWISLSIIVEFIIRYMHFDVLKVFSDLARTESFSQAAKLNRITQSAVSQQMQVLEKEIGFSLLKRSKRQISLTHEGEIFAAFVKDVLQRWDDLQHDLMAIQGRLRGKIAISTIYSIGLYGIKEEMKQFWKYHPDIDVQLEYKRSTQVYEDVLNEKVELGLVAFPEQYNGLGHTILWKDVMVLVAAPGHHLGDKNKVYLQDLEGLPLVEFVKGLPTRLATDALFEQAGVQVNVVMAFDNIETIKSAVEMGSGFALLPYTTVVNELEKGLLSLLPLEDETFSRPLAAIYKKQDRLSPAARAFIEILKRPSLSLKDIYSLYYL